LRILEREIISGRNSSVGGILLIGGIHEVYAVQVQYDRQNEKLVYPAPEKIFPSSSEKLPVCFVAGDQERFDGIRESREPFISIFRSFYCPSRKSSPTMLQRPRLGVGQSFGEPQDRN